jgi:hypothetical protein
MGTSDRSGQARHRAGRSRGALAATLWTPAALGAVLAAALWALPAAPAGAAALGPSTRVTVKPGSGTAQTHFALSFRVPVGTGTFGSLVRTDILSVSGPRAAHCQSRVTRTLRRAKKGTRLTLTLRPAKGRGGWCTGQWRGTVVQREVIRCTPIPARVCPELVVAPRTIARFRFRVRPTGLPSPPAPPAGDVPTFAGLVSATTCPSPEPVGADVLPRPTGYRLIWDAATDPVTPSSQIVYDIFVATTPGSEDYATPTYTTTPGATTFVTPSVPRNGPLYFVVRARNAAGREDANTVERQGVIQCTPVPQPARR